MPLAEDGPPQHHHHHHHHHRPRWPKWTWIIGLLLGVYLFFGAVIFGGEWLVRMTESTTVGGVESRR